MLREKTQSKDYGKAYAKTKDDKLNQK